MTTLALLSWDKGAGLTQAQARETSKAGLKPRASQRKNPRLFLQLQVGGGSWRRSSRQVLNLTLAWLGFKFTQALLSLSRGGRGGPEGCGVGTVPLMQQYIWKRRAPAWTLKFYNSSFLQAHECHGPLPPIPWHLSKAPSPPT